MRPCQRDIPVSKLYNYYLRHALLINRCVRKSDSKIFLKPSYYNILKIMSNKINKMNQINEILVLRICINFKWSKHIFETF